MNFLVFTVAPRLGLNSLYNDDRLVSNLTGNREGVDKAPSLLWVNVHPDVCSTKTEQRTHKPLVASSNLAAATTKLGD